VLDDLSAGLAHTLPEAAELLVGDVRDAEGCRVAVADADVVVHLAAPPGITSALDDPGHDFSVNAEGTLNVLEAARRRGRPRVVLASTTAPLFETGEPIHEGMVPRPTSPYAAGKLAAEGYCAAYARGYGVPAVVLRVTNVYGPGSVAKEGAVARFLRDGMAGRDLTITGDGRQTRDFLYVDDVVRAIRLAAQAPGAGDGAPIQLGAGRETEIAELARLVGDTLANAGMSAPGVTYAPARPGDVARCRVASKRAQSLLGWAPTVALQDGLGRTRDYFADLLAGSSGAAAGGG
jgi:UDP-glucose 4-epimerase